MYVLPFDNISLEPSSRQVWEGKKNLQWGCATPCQGNVQVLGPLQLPTPASAGELPLGRGTPWPQSHSLFRTPRRRESGTAKLNRPRLEYVHCIYFVSLEPSKLDQTKQTRIASLQLREKPAHQHDLVLLGRGPFFEWHHNLTLRSRRSSSP